MKRIIARAAALAGVSLLISSFAASQTQASKLKPSDSALPDDWSHRHLIFSRPASEQQAARVQQDARYSLQQRREQRPIATLVTGEQETSRFRFWQHHRHHRRGRHLHRDWAFDLGPGASVGAANFPAKYSFNTSVATCGLAANPDFVVYGTGLAGSVSQGSIVAFTNLYSGCSGQVPGVYWSINTGGAVNTSPVLSWDGTQIAFTQTSGGVGSLVLLKYKAFDGLVQSPATDLTTVLPGAYFGCTAPCMTTFALGSANDTHSSVFYDYSSDSAWVGDDSGVLHQYTNIFKGTPAEVTTGGWPVTVSSGHALTSPVYDRSSTNIFVGDSTGHLNRVTSAGAVTASGLLVSTVSLTESPVVDSVAGSAYVFSPNDGAGNAGVFQLSTAFAAGTTGTEAIVGTSTAAAVPLYIGAFDHDYIISATSTGNLYVCGNPGGQPTLYQIPILSGVMGTVLAGPVISGTTGASCSPVSDVYNPNVSGPGTPNEWVFMSTQANGVGDPCGGFSCIMNFRNTSWQPNTAYNAGQLVLDSNLNIQVADNSGGTSGSTPPVWSTTVFGPTVDGTVHWRNQGTLSAQTPASWAANFSYPGAFEIVDSNNNIEIAQLGGGVSGSTTPTWSLSEGATVVDGTVTWYNLGANPSSALQASGGTSGIVIDNVVTSPGGSQVYFSNLADTGCATSGGTGGCAVQASQQGLN